MIKRILHLYFSLIVTTYSVSCNYDTSVLEELNEHPNSVTNRPLIGLSSTSFLFQATKNLTKQSNNLLLSNLHSETIFFGDFDIIQASSTFSIDVQGCTTMLAPKSSCVISLGYLPRSANASDEGLLKIAFGPTPETLSSEATVTLKAVPGDDPRVEPAANTGSNELELLTMNPTAYDFGPVSLSASENKTVVITNSGTTDITIRSVLLSGDPAFTLTHNCTNTLSKGASCTVSVAFSPSHGSTVGALLLVEYNGGNQKALSVIGKGGSSLIFNGIDTVNNVGAVSGRLNWSLATGGSVSAYQVRQLVGGTWQVIATLANTATHYVVTGLSPGSTYSWRVFALDGFGVSDGNTVTKSAATSVVDFDAISPADLSLTEGFSKTVNLSCSDSIGSVATYSLVSVTDPDIGCTLSGSVLTCVPTNKSGHSDWSSNVNLRCVINGATINKSESFAVADFSRPPVLTAASSRLFPNHIIVGTPITLNNTATDADGDTITYSCEVRSNNLGTQSPFYATPGTNCNALPAIQGTTATFNPVSGAFSWTPSNSQLASYTFTITANDGYGKSDSESFTLVSHEPWSQTADPSVVFDARYADGGTTNGLTSQTTTWSDISGNGVHLALQGTTADHWKGSGNPGDPVYLALDGVDDYAEINTSGIASTKGSRFVLYFRIPSAAANGTHMIASFTNLWGVGFRKGSGENYLHLATYDGVCTASSGANSIPTDTWLELTFGSELGMLDAANRRKNVDVRHLDGTLLWSSGSSCRGNPQVGLAAQPIFLGYKPSEAGPPTGILASGTARFGMMHILSGQWDEQTYTSAWNSSSWGRQSAHFAAEINRLNPIGDTRLSSLIKYFDAAFARNGVSSFVEGTNCEAVSATLQATGVDEIYGFSGTAGTVSNVSNPSCASINSGWQGTGVPANPYRLAFDGVNDRFLFSENITYPASQTFDHTTMANSFDIWARPSNTGNALVRNGFGPVLYYTESGTAGVFHQLGLGILNNGNGTSSLQLNLKTQAEGNLDVTNTGILLDNAAWVHLALSVSAGGVTSIYKNGVLSYTSAFSLTQSPLQRDATCNSASRRCSFHHLGGASGTSSGVNFEGSYFSGDIALYRAYRGHALTSSQALFNCNHGKSRFLGASCGP